LALLILSTGSLEGELRHRARITQARRLRVAAEPGSVRLRTYHALNSPVQRRGLLVNAADQNDGKR
jgi:hypothetical protein